MPNALEQAKQVASASPATPRLHPEAPWFWSDQYDLKLQIAGIPFYADSIIIRGDRAAARFAIFHLKGDQVQAVEAVNAPPEFMGKSLILSRKPVPRERLADSSISMKEVALGYLQRLTANDNHQLVVPFAGQPWIVSRQSSQPMRAR